LEQRRRAEKALLAVVQAAYVQGVSTRKVDELLQALGLTGIDTPALAGGARESKVSRICRELDVFVDAFRNRPLEGSYPYLWLDALYLKVRQDHRIVSQALIVAIAVRDTGDREILGVSLGQSEEYAFSRKDTPFGPRSPSPPGRDGRDGVAGLSAGPGAAWLEGREVGHQRCPRRTEGGGGAPPGIPGAIWIQLAAQAFPAFGRIRGLAPAAPQDDRLFFRGG